MRVSFEAVRHCLAACVLLAQAGLTTGVYAACSRPIRVAASPGFGITIDEKSQIGGGTGVLLEEIGRAAGCPFEYTFVPRTRAIYLYLKGEIDVLPSATRNPERDSAGNFIQVGTASVALVGLAKRINGLDPLDRDLSGDFVVETIRGYDYGPEYRRLVTKLRASQRANETVDPELAIRKLESGRTDGILVAPGILVPFIAAAGLNDAVAALPLPGIPPVPFGPYVSNKSMATSDRAQVLAVFTSPANQHAFWRAVQSSAPSWLHATLREMPLARP